ncbi:hypothetical protein MIR68_008361 [Amoeboaphelidium protococcarum]|nr:hypothetical protein MIR68_008361 [Amoeboaphelidium protococcarum]
MVSSKQVGDKQSPSRQARQLSTSEVNRQSSSSPSPPHTPPSSPGASGRRRRLLFGSLLVGGAAVLLAGFYSSTSSSSYNLSLFKMNQSAGLHAVSKGTLQQMYDRVPQHPARHFKGLIKSDGSSTVPLTELKTIVDKVLRENSYRFIAPQWDIHVNQVASNPQMEDRHSIDLIQGTLYMSVHDGHSGSACAESLRHNYHKYLHHYAMQKVNKATADAHIQDVSTVSALLKNASNTLDKELCKSALDTKYPLYEDLLASSLSGAVSATAIVNGQSLLTAHTGDVRVVMNKQSPDGKYQQLTEDHNPEGNLNEKKRLLKEHPNEPYVIYHGRILGGLMPSRAFGDGRYKWTLQEMERLNQRIQDDLIPSDGSSSSGSSIVKKKQYLKNGISAPPQYHSPPYVTAEPEVSLHKIQAVSGKESTRNFVIIASDGLWDTMSSEEAAGYVEEYLQLQKQQHQQSTDKQQNNNNLDTNAAVYLTRKAVEFLPNQTEPMRDDNGKIMTMEELKSRVAIQILSLDQKVSRRYRDDITVIVAFQKDKIEDAEDGHKSSDDRDDTVYQLKSIDGDIQFKSWTEQIIEKYDNLKAKAKL